MNTDTATPLLLPLRIVVGSMIIGTMAFAIVSFFLAGDSGLGQSEPNNGLVPMLLLVLSAFGLGLLAAFPLIRRNLLSRLRSEWRGGAEPAAEDSRVFGQFQTLALVRAAMAEGFALFATVVYLLTASPIALAGTAVGVVVLIRLFPTEHALQKFAAEVSGRSIS